MVGQFLDAPGFDSGPHRTLAWRVSQAITALFAAGALSLSLLIAIAILSLELLRAPAGLVL